MAKTVTHKDRANSSLAAFLFEYNGPSKGLVCLAATAAKTTGKLEWLKDRYKEAIAAAKQHHLVAQARSLLCLAQLHIESKQLDEAIQI